MYKEFFSRVGSWELFGASQSQGYVLSRTDPWKSSPPEAQRDTLRKHNGTSSQVCIIETVWHFLMTHYASCAQDCGYFRHARRSLGKGLGWWTLAQSFCSIRWCRILQTQPFDDPSLTLRTTLSSRNAPFIEITDFSGLEHCWRHFRKCKSITKQNTLQRFCCFWTFLTRKCYISFSSAFGITEKTLPRHCFIMTRIYYAFALQSLGTDMCQLS